MSSQHIFDDIDIVVPSYMTQPAAEELGCEDVSDLQPVKQEEEDGIIEMIFENDTEMASELSEVLKDG